MGLLKPIDRVAADEMMRDLARVLYAPREAGGETIALRWDPAPGSDADPVLVTISTGPHKYIMEQILLHYNNAHARGNE